jgi:hypothetical protein
MIDSESAIGEVTVAFLSASIAIVSGRLALERSDLHS